MVIFYSIELVKDVFNYHNIIVCECVCVGGCVAVGKQFVIIIHTNVSAAKIK